MSNSEENKAAQAADGSSTGTAPSSENLAAKRKAYYSDWDKLAKTETGKVKEEEKKKKEEADAKLGLDKDTPKSEAEERDRKKHEALKEAKKMWQDREEKSEAQKYVFDGDRDKTVVITKNMIEHKPVLVIQNAVGCTYDLHDDAGTLIKAFISDCEDCVFLLGANLITQHVEISHCTNISVDVKRPLATLQLDLCSGVVVTYGQNVMREGDKLYHSGVEKLKVHHHDIHSVDHSYDLVEIQDDHLTPKQEVQFVTHLQVDRLVTERVIRNRGEMPMTEAELRKTADADDIVLKRERQAELKKIGGNEAFQNGEYLQASVFYTQALELGEPDNATFLSICLSNRAACWLKLGHSDKALDDAEASLALKESTKGLFRKGIALHAMEKYAEACIVLSKALKLEPNNQQIKQAYGFAELKARKKAKGEDD